MPVTHPVSAGVQVEVYKTNNLSKSAFPHLFTFSLLFVINTSRGNTYSRGDMEKKGKLKNICLQLHLYTYMYIQNCVLYFIVLVYFLLFARVRRL